ncbi:glycosyltransferase [Flavobacterium terrigena]|uniref:Glycosyl transferase family 2 n=1 Tax=Flavobacterium terrigena TaxID=402734 RepID=A0A1H6RAZ7_9FLAO|nr:glycosyltransferase [Flavobacterium terrigena]SEI48372.1 Glycosyl transferase family 2 [Flavobacterium terrigena]
MRVGNNPHKDKETTHANYLHQIVIPVYIPNLEAYFKDSFQILQLCVNSLLETIHDKTFVTIINNGSCLEIRNYLDNLYENNKIHEVIHTENIGKLNAILKGISGNNIPYVTISDSDVLFCSNWQEETMNVFHSFKKVGVVGITPQFKTYETYCGNVLFENYFSKQLKFTQVEQPVELEKFYESIGWGKEYNQDYLKYTLSIENSNCKALIGSGHYVATYKKVIFTEMPTFIGFKMGGTSEAFLDKIPLKYGLWRLTTAKNFAFHMGNVFEDWMSEIKSTTATNFNFGLYAEKGKIKNVSNIEFFIKNKLFNRLCFSKRFFKKLFYKNFGLPKQMRNNY